MVFSSLEFIYLFLPPVLAGFLILRALRLETAIIWWLIAASLAFYAWWSPWHLLLLLGSVCVNYGLHKAMQRYQNKALLVFGIAGNLVLLAWFKYADFMLDNINIALGQSIDSFKFILPLAISFFTFQQISFLMDTWHGKITDCDFKRYTLFVTFFPQLIAGPIVLQHDTVPQFKLANFSSKTTLNISIGMTLFAIGMFKKIVLADGVAPTANLVFDAADAGQTLPMDQAWIGVLAYTFQIYFDFSGYCDMALGLARMFGIKLPINFNSPYKALSITEFWQRWHITLSRFLKNYLYIPLGGNRYGILGSRGNLLLTMLLGGLWHGAGWNFIIWGGLHGLYLIANHLWQDIKSKLTWAKHIPVSITVMASWAITMIAVVTAWVFFRAETFSGAANLLQAMFIPVQNEFGILATSIIGDTHTIALALATMIVIVTALPNSIEIIRSYRPVIDTLKELARNETSGLQLAWRPNAPWVGVIAIGLGTALIQVYRLNDMTEFIYFNF